MARSDDRFGKPNGASVTVESDVPTGASDGTLALVAPVPATMRGRVARQAFLDAGRQVFEREGYFRATVADIVALTDLSIGSFYRYFPNKETLLLELMRQVVEEMYESARHRWEGADIRASLYGTTKGHLAAYVRNQLLLSAISDYRRVSPDAHRMWEDVQMKVRQRMERHVRTALAERSDTTIDAHLATLALSGMVEVFAQRVIVENLEGSVSVHQASQVLAEIWYRSIFSPTAATSVHGWVGTSSLEQPSRS